MADPLIDSVVAQYQIQSRLGGGAMGVVYKARDLKLGRLVALKFLPPEWSHDEDAKQRFVREAQAASSTDHANICTVHDIQSTEDGRLFIVMAYYEGQTLKQRIAQGPLTIAEALSIATQVADGLARAHAAGVVHRDVKPGNVIVTEDAVKIVDFGLATLAGSVQLTQAGSPMGTVGYMSPEQLRGLGATPQSDVWAVGVMLYEMLAGHPPFQGAYAEALSYAIRHDTPPPLREGRPEIPEEVEQLVFRALHKDAGVRFASGRELARALRQVQGHTVPLDLLTGPVHVVARPAPAGVATRVLRRAAVAVAVLAVAAGGVYWYLSRPVPRTFIAIAPVANSTGDATLDPYRMGLTLALARELGESNDVRVLPYTQMLAPLRRFVLARADVSSPDAVKALQGASAAGVVVAPTLLYDRGAWRASAELRDAAGASLGRVDTEPLESSLPKEAAATLVGALATRIEARFRPRRWTLRSESKRPAQFASLDAAQAFEQGLGAYDAGEYAAARDAFARAEKEDSRHPLPAAWRARVALAMGNRKLATEAADQAEARLRVASPVEARFVQAVVAEARRQDENADRWYAELADAHPDDRWARLELAAYQDRSGKTPDAIASYRRLLDEDARQPGPALELCRLYISPRMNDAKTARGFGERARQGFEALGASTGEAQAMLCLSEVLRGGTAAERATAKQFANDALAKFESLGSLYGVSRAHFYVAHAARAQGDMTGAAAAFVRSLASAKAVGNASLEGVVYNMLGVAYITLGDVPKALDYYRQSYETAESAGDNRRAAYSRANAGALLIEFGSPPDEGRRFVEGALRVVRRQDVADRNFEVFCLQLLAVHDRLTGRFAEARKGLSEAIEMASSRGFTDRIPSLLLDDGRTLMDMGEYTQAGETFEKAIATGGGSAPDLLVERARLRMRLGDFEGATAALDQASTSAGVIEAALAPRLEATRAEVAYSQGRVKEARAAFERASKLWTGPLPDAASVEARAFLGFLDGLDGRAQGRQAVIESMEQAARMQRPAVEAVIRVLLARLELHARRPAQALAALDGLPLAPLSPELQAQVLYWRAEARDAQSPDSGEGDRREAHQAIERAGQGVPTELRERYFSRPDLRAMSSVNR